MCEFAKRIFYRGVEVTPFPVSAVEGACRNPVLMGATLVAEARKGLRARSGIPVAVKKLKGILDPGSSGKIRRAWGRAAFEAEWFQSLLLGEVSGDEFVRRLFSRDPVLRGRPDLLAEGVGSRLLGLAAAELFCASMNRSPKRGGNSVTTLLMQVLEQCLPAITTATNQVPQQDSGVEGYPVSNPGLPVDVMRHIPIFSSLEGIGDSILDALGGLPSGEFSPDFWSVTTRTMVFSDELLWKYQSEAVQRLAVGTQLARTIRSLALDPNIHDPRKGVLDVSRFIAKLPFYWLFPPRADEPLREIS